jgi:hypothetical protein
MHIPAYKPLLNHDSHTLLSTLQVRFISCSTGCLDSTTLV